MVRGLWVLEAGQRDFPYKVLTVQKKKKKNKNKGAEQLQ